jgi:hypothetical protein
MYKPIGKCTDMAKAHASVCVPFSHAAVQWERESLVLSQGRSTRPFWLYSDEFKDQCHQQTLLSSRKQNTIRYFVATLQQ